MGQVFLYSSLVSLKEIEAEGFNLNIRRYVDNTPAPEPHDVKAHLHGGIPKVEWNSELLESYALKTKDVFKDKDKVYFDFIDSINEKVKIRESLEASRQFEKTDEMIQKIVASWYDKYQVQIDDKNKDIAALCQEGIPL